MSKEDLAVVLGYAAEASDLVALGVEGVVRTVLKLLAGALGKMS
jgi:hypothetical protein